MIKKQILFIAAVAAISVSNFTFAQSPISGFMQGKGKGNISISYGSEKYDKVYFIPEEVQGVPIFNEVQVNSASIYGTYGITDQIDVVVALPYITSKGMASQDVLNNLGLENERSGLQDVSVFIKYNPFYFDLGSSSLRLIGAVGLKTPLGSYKVDEGVQSIIAIGNRSTTISTTGLAMFKTDSGIFASAQLAGNFASKEVPNAITTEVKVGFAASKFYVDGFVATQKSSGGVDIFGEGFKAFFPETNVNFTKIGLNAYAPVYKDLGLAAGVSSLVAGRNIGKATGFYGGVVYKF